MAFFYKENIGAERLVKDYFSILERKNNEYFNGDLSVLLLGSLSRNEGTWIEKDGSIELLSDIEFFTIYPANFNSFDVWDKALLDASNEIFKHNQSILFHIDNTYISLAYLPRIEKKLLTFDAQNMGITMVGKDYKSLLPYIDSKNINYHDIKDILTHRVFSVLYYGYRLKLNGDIVGYRYSLAKNSLDLMTVMLLQKGLLISGFINRYQAIQSLSIDNDIKKYFQYCLDIKLGVSTNEEYSIEEMEKTFIYLADNLHKEFSCPIKNTLLNASKILKRFLGKAKRALKYRHIPSFKHYCNLSQQFKGGNGISDISIKDNLVLNGYPLI